MKDFIDYLKKLQEYAGNNVEMSDKVKEYIEKLYNKSTLTENGKKILDYLQNHNEVLTSKQIGEGLEISSRTVSGSIRKLVEDGFVDKIDNNPVKYQITENGKNYKIKGENE